MNRSRSAFTLVEVVLSLGVLTFAILLLLALVPAGLQTNRDTREESAATNIIAALVADWRASGGTNTSTLFRLPALGAGMSPTNTVWISDAGQPVSAGEARYRVSYRVTAPPRDSLLPYYVAFSVAWPAQATNGAGKVEAVAALPAL